jgi:hypothetical protein
MNETDKLIADWAMAQFRKENPIYFNDAYSYAHLHHCDTAVIAVDDMEWSCGCYSEYTRDDYFYMNFVVNCACGFTAKFQLQKSYGLPQFIEELDAFKNNEECPYN